VFVTAAQVTSIDFSVPLGAVPVGTAATDKGVASAVLVVTETFVDSAELL
jgi:hypothetical protein